MKPNERNNYKSTQIIQSESLHRQVLTTIIWKFKKLSDTTWLQNMQQRSSLVCTQVITNKSDMFNLHLRMKPHEGNNYKSTQIIQSESPHKHILTAIV